MSAGKPPIAGAIPRLLEPDEGWRPLAPAVRQGKKPAEIGKGVPKDPAGESVYRGLAYAASIPDNSPAGEFGEFFRYPYAGTPGDYGTRAPYGSSAAPTSTGVKQTVARLTARRGTAYADTRRGILEGGRIAPFSPQAYWVREDGGDTDEVWTNAGETIWTRNKAVAGYVPTADWLRGAMAWPFGDAVILVAFTSQIGWIPRPHNPKLASDRGMAVTIITDSGNVHPRGAELTSPTSLTPYPGRFIQPAVSQGGGKFAVFDGTGWAKEYTLSAGPVATETASRTPAFSGSYPATFISGDANACTWAASQDVQSSYAAALYYDHDTLAEITATVRATLSGSASASRVSDGDQTDYTHAGSAEKRQTETLAWSGGSLVTHDLLRTYEGSAAWMQRSNTLSSRDVTYQTDVVITSAQITRTPLLIDPHNGVLAYFEATETKTVEFHEDHAHSDVFAGWVFRSMAATNDGFFLFIPDGQNSALLGTDPIDAQVATAHVVRNAKVVVHFGGQVFENASDDFVTDTTGTALNSEASWINQGDTLTRHAGLFPVMQGQCPYMAYRRPNTTNAEMIFAHAATIPNVTPTTYLNSAFTEQGVEDWLTACGAPAAVTSRVATCFRVGGS